VGLVELPAGRQAWRFDSLAQFPQLAHTFSLRTVAGGGNISLSGSRDQDAARDERRACCLQLGVAPDDLVVSGQIHAADLQLVDDSHRGRGALAADSVIPACDGLLTTTPNLPLMCAVGDCAAILLFVPGDSPGLAVLHAGWRGLVEQIIPCGVAALCAATASTPGMVHAGISPCIGWDSFQVGPEVSEHAPTSCRRRWPQAVDKWAVHLAGWGQDQLQKSGVRTSRIEVAELDSFTAREHCFSHRRQGVEAGRMGLFASLL
jgi:hypothetical protein